MYTKKEVIKKLLPIFKEHPIKKAILFGSYAKGNQTKISDIDLLIDSNGQIQGIDFFGILEEINSVFDVQVDLLESSQIIKGSKVYKEIQKSGVVIYECA